MNDKAKALYEAHVAHVLNNLGPDNLPDLVSEESGYVWEKLDGVKLNEVISKDEILDFQKRNFDHREKVSEPAKTYGKSLRDAVIAHLKSSDTTLKDIISKNDYDAIIKEASTLKEVREEIIHSAVSNPLYSEIIANSLADGIKSFTSEEGLAGKIPGASSFFKMGSGLLGGIQDSIDKNIRKFIAANIQKLTGQSEKFVQNLIDDRKVKELGEKLWQKTSTKTVGSALRRFDASQYDGFEPIVERVVNQALRSDAAQELNEVIIDHFLEENGGKSLQQLLLDIEIEKEDVVRESVELFGKICERAMADGTLEERVRKHLEDFYASDVVAEIL
ncbi:MAG: hypothetical protein GY751_01175 [Bacteroidetes bacterium]|nr:hypothetical protein [Bacteroidota bacterium]